MVLILSKRTEFVYTYVTFQNVMQLCYEFSGAMLVSSRSVFVSSEASIVMAKRHSNGNGFHKCVPHAAHEA